MIRGNDEIASKGVDDITSEYELDYYKKLDLCFSKFQG